MHNGDPPPSIGLLSARRPSWTLSVNPFTESSRYSEQSQQPAIAEQQLGAQPVSSPDDGGTFRRNLQIDMKGLVGDAVGNCVKILRRALREVYDAVVQAMSISPASRDVVLAARLGLFIIDLEAPLEIPRFLPQGGTWDVADVQWNPHSSRSERIVSTSSEKLLIWNLLLVGKTSIEHVLQSHYRAITDINWHTSEPDTVISTGIDSWLWSWDLRVPLKPVFGLCAFNAGGTQVKWNRQDANILASSHLNEVLIWDRRKGSLPLSRIKAHNAKIYGIDWSHQRRNDIVTCSLDKTIKVWDVQDSPLDSGTREPKWSVETRYPVWRARDLPFGDGVLSLPQRSETALEMWAAHDSRVPVEVFEGHLDVVKEFVWRKGGTDHTDYQLITWSKDRTLRFWPIDSEMMQKAGHVYDAAKIRSKNSHDLDNNYSFRHPPKGTDLPPALSAPVGNRSILAEVRASHPIRKPNPVLQPHHGSAARARSHEAGYFPAGSEASYGPSVSLTTPSSVRQGGTMSRGNVGGKSARMDAFTWLANVKVGDRRDGSSGPGSGAESGNASRQSSSSRPVSGRSHSVIAERHKRSKSRDIVIEQSREGENNKSLQDEIMAALTKLSSTHNKIRLEKHDLTKRRTCTLGLHGPWGDSSSVFVRVSFRFPKEYPFGVHPHGTPDIDVERSPLISMQTRAFMLRRLRAIREQRQPCLEACLKFLLFGAEDERVDAPLLLDSESSSEEESQVPRKTKDSTILLLRNNKNLAEPRTSQGTFGLNGELVCFFRGPPRIVRNYLQDMPSPTATSSKSPQNRFLQSPASISDAIYQLDLAAADRDTVLTDLKKYDGEGGNILRVMTNILTVRQRRNRADSDARPPNDVSPSKYALISPRRSVVFITRRPDHLNAYKEVASGYVFHGRSLAEVCEKNAEIARGNELHEQERVFRILQSLLTSFQNNDRRTKFPTAFPPRGSFTERVIKNLYNDLSAHKDIQMLAMLSVIIMNVYHSLNPIEVPSPKESVYDTSKSEVEYFSLVKRKDSRSFLLSPALSRLTPSSPTSFPLVASLSSSNSSRGSWSSLFNTNTVRQFMSGAQDIVNSSNDVLSGVSRATIPVPRSSDSQRKIASGSPRKGYVADSTFPSTPQTSKSWSELSSTLNTKTSITFLSAGHPQPPNIPQTKGNHRPIQERRALVFQEPEEFVDDGEALFNPHFLSQLLCHIYSYAEMLFNWQLLHKRAELLNIVKFNNHVKRRMNSSKYEFEIDIRRKCARCGAVCATNSSLCPSNCGTPILKPSCSICRLPVKGLAYNCPQCLHLSHIKCWDAKKYERCSTGCGCLCRNFWQKDGL